METADRNTRDLKHGYLNEKPKEPQVNHVTKEPPKQNSRQGTRGNQKNADVAEASFMMPISAGLKKKSDTDAVRRVTKETSVAVNVKRVFKSAT